MVILTDVRIVISDDIVHYGCCDGSGRVSRKEIHDKICDNLSDTGQYVLGVSADEGRANKADFYGSLLFHDETSSRPEEVGKFGEGREMRRFMIEFCGNYLMLFLSFS